MSAKTLSSHNANRCAMACRRAGAAWWRGTGPRWAGALALSLGTLAVFSLPAQAANGYFGGGTGAPNNPYLVQDAADLAAINNDAAHLAASYKLAGDIDLTAWLAPGGPGYNGGAGWNPIGACTDLYSYVSGAYNFSGAFTGNFDGAGHKIAGLWINRDDMIYVGLFACISESASIANLGVEITGAGVTNNRNVAVGGLAGVFNGGSISNSYATGGVTSNYGHSSAGGLVGAQYSGSIINSYATGDAAGHGENYVGGLVGSQFGGSIASSYASGGISVRAGGGAVGGLVGRQSSGSITNSYATGSVAGDINGYTHVGGLVGRQDGGGITNSYATGNLSYNVGTSASHNSFIGGLVGYQADYGNSSPTNSASFFDMQTTGQANGVGCGSAASVTGKTTAEMQTQATFAAAGWDFASAAPVWFVPPGSYPKLSWQYVTPTLAQSYTITASAIPNGAGTISSAGAVAVSPGTTQAFMITPAANRSLYYVTGTCGGIYRGNTYTTRAVNNNCTVTAVFR